MYVFKSSFLKAKKTNIGYQNIDVSNIPMRELSENYLDGYIVLTHTQLRGTFYLTIEALRSSKLPITISQTFNQWLTHNHDKQLPTINTKPEYIQGVVKYGDAFQSEFRVDQVARYMPITANVSKADKVDLLLRKGIPDPNALYKRMLVTVNGFLHRGFTHEDGVAIAGGGTTFNNTGVNTVGILSFYDVCDLKQYKITENMITPSSSTSPLYHEVLINLGIPLINRSVLMSLGGHLITDNAVVDIVNAEVGIVIVRLKKLDIVKMIMNSVSILNLDSLGVFQETKNITYNKVKPADLTSDIIIKKYLQLEQSFVIVAECDSIHTEFSEVGVTGLPGLYEVPKEPRYPMIDSQGVLCEYIKSNTSDVWAIRLTDDITKKYMYKTNIDYDNETINSMSPTYRWYHDDPRFVKIVSTRKAIPKI